MLTAGRLDAVQATARRVPREIARTAVSLVSKLGKGQFGEVWKGLLDESAITGVPAYLVAVKTVLNAAANPDGLAELVQEAAVMAQVGMHPNLVALIGVHGARFFCEQNIFVAFRMLSESHALLVA
jgi:hypothetical protein